MKKQKVVVEQLANESMSDFVKFRLFLQLGANRDLAKAYHMYYETENEMSPAWKTLAEQNHWVDRAKAYDQTVQAPSK